MLIQSVDNDLHVFTGDVSLCDTTGKLCQGEDLHVLSRRTNTGEVLQPSKYSDQQ